MKIKRIAHRGFSSEAPENTQASFAMAVEGDFYGVECDIWKSKDGVYVVSHDGHLRRMCGIDRWIPQMTFEEIISYPVTAGKKREEHPLQHLISFSQYLSIMARSETIHPIVELKMDYTTVELREIVDLVKQKGLLERTVFISMHLLALLRLKDIGIPASRLQYVYGAVGGNKWTKVSDELIAWLTENEISLDSRYTLVSKEDVEKKQHDIAEIQKTILASSDSHGELEQKLRESVEQKEQMSAEYRGFFRKQEEISERCNGLDKEVFRLNNQREKLNESAEQQTNYLWEEYELTRREAEDCAVEIDDSKQAQRRLNELKQKIRSLGNVNVSAIEEYKEVSERYEFMSAQVNDVEKSKKEIEKLITDLTKQMKEVFVESFDQINKNFTYTFKELFGGGTASLSLADPENILTSGIDILVHPPGKIVINLEALSGGEKALVAIALYFAIMKVRPAPFCVMDEIEAALDDVNVYRFAAYLRRMTDNTQFILITHRRGTMEEADVLYGVTMQDEGISKLLELRSTEVAEKLGIDSK